VLAGRGAALGHDRGCVVRPGRSWTSTIRITGPERPNKVKVYATCGTEVSKVSAKVAQPDDPISQGLTGGSTEKKPPV
jgi:hypothetical protein